MSGVKRKSRAEIMASDLDFLTNEYEIPWHKLRNKTVLITGAAGFLATYMLETLLFLNKRQQLNVSILALVRRRDAFEKCFPLSLKSQELICIEQDVCSRFHINQPIDFIIHAASQASPKYYATDPVGTLSANTLGTANLLDLAREHQVESFLYFSSAEVYGDAIKVPTEETDYGHIDPLDVRSCYAESKRMGENMCVSWHYQYGVPAKIVRPFHTYGPGMSLDDGRVYADFVADIVNNRDIILKSDGLSRRAFCYVADAIAGFWMVLLCAKSSQAYNIGNPDGEISIRDLAVLISELDPERRVSLRFEKRKELEKYLPSQVDVSCPDITLARNLGWIPRTPINDGFRKTIESYQS